MSPIFKSDTARAIAKEVGLNDVSSMPKSSGKNKKRSLTISGSNPAVREALNNHQAKQEQFANRAIDDLDMEQALRNNDDGGLCTPDVIKSALDPKSEGSKISETTIDRLFGVPDKIVIPERYIPDTVSLRKKVSRVPTKAYFLLQDMDNLTPEERQVRLKKADSIRRMLAEQPSAGQTNKGILHKETFSIIYITEKTAFSVLQRMVNPT